MNLAWENETSFSPTQPGLQTVHQISPCFLLPVAHPIHTVNLARKQLGCSFWFFPSPYPCQKEIDAGAPTSPAQVVIVAHSPAALLPPPLPPLSSLCNSKLLSINQIKRFCLLKSCQLPPIASSHRFVQGLTQPACACSVTSSPHPPTPVPLVLALEHTKLLPCPGLRPAAPQPLLLESVLGTLLYRSASAPQMPPPRDLPSITILARAAPCRLSMHPYPLFPDLSLKWFIFQVLSLTIGRLASREELQGSVYSCLPSAGAGSGIDKTLEAYVVSDPT